MELEDIKTILVVIAVIVNSMNNLTVWGLLSIIIVLTFICIIAWICNNPTKTNVIKYVHEKGKAKPKKQERSKKNRRKSCMYEALSPRKSDETVSF